MQLEEINFRADDVVQRTFKRYTSPDSLRYLRIVEINSFKYVANKIDDVKDSLGNNIDFIFNSLFWNKI